MIPLFSMKRVVLTAVIRFHPTSSAPPRSVDAGNMHILGSSLGQDFTVHLRCASGLCCVVVVVVVVAAFRQPHTALITWLVLVGMKLVADVVMSMRCWNCLQLE